MVKIPSTLLGKLFLATSLLLLVALAAIYVFNVRQALNMDPASYNCTQDSMMKQVCADPYGSSVFWSLMTFGFMGWPAILAWMGLGIKLLSKRGQATANASYTDAEHKT